MALPDTGAYCSVFPKRIAKSLGFKDSELASEKPVTVVGGQPVAAWSPPETVYAQIRADFPEGSSLWGPSFALEVLFIDHEDSLLGRVDFFNAFDVVFAKDGPALHVYYS